MKFREYIQGAKRRMSDLKLSHVSSPVPIQKGFGFLGFEYVIYKPGWQVILSLSDVNSSIVRENLVREY